MNQNQATPQTAPAQGQEQQGQPAETVKARPKNPTTAELFAKIVPLYMLNDRNRRPFGDF